MSTTDSGITWRRSSYSDTSGGNCVELAGLDDAIGVRDSKNPEVGFLVLRKSVLRQLAGRMRDL